MSAFFESLRTAILTHSLAPDDVWLTFMHEPDDDVSGSTGSGMTAGHYRDAWARMVDLMVDMDLRTRVRTLWVVMGFEENRPLYPNLWPGNALVDLVGEDPYIGGSADPLLLAQKMLSRLEWWQLTADAAHAWGRDKQHVFGEWGADVASAGARGTDEHRGKAIAEVHRRLPELEAAGLRELIFFDAGQGYMSVNGPDVAAYRAMKLAQEAAR